MEGKFADTSSLSKDTGGACTVSWKLDAKDKGRVFSLLGHFLSLLRVHGHMLVPRDEFPAPVEQLYLH